MRTETMKAEGNSQLKNKNDENSVANGIVDSF